MSLVSWYQSYLPPLPWHRGEASNQPSLPETRAVQYNPGGTDVSLADRWLILGTTGSGKTTFSRELVRHLLPLYRPTPPLYILDSKMQGDFEEFPNHVYTDVAPNAIKEGVQVWSPSLENFEEYDAWFWGILHAPGPAIVLIDEVSSLTKGQGDAPDNYVRLLKQGRGKKKCVINCTQEIAKTPRQIRGQTTHVVRFHLIDPYDMRQGNQLTKRDTKAPEPRGRFGFIYSRTDKTEGPREFRSHQEFL